MEDRLKMKKSISMTILIAMILLLSVSTASASLSGPTTVPVVLGGTSTSAANPNYDDDAGKDSSVTGTFTLTSSGAGNITSLACTISPANGYKNILSNNTDDYDDDLNMVVTLPDTTLINDSFMTVDVAARIPAKLNDVDGDGDPTSYKTSTITCT